MSEQTHDHTLHDCAVNAARLYENLGQQESERRALRRQWLARLAADPELKELDSQIAIRERSAKSLRDALKGALVAWQEAVAAAYKDGWEKQKTFQDGMVTAVTRKNIVIHADSSAMLQFGMSVIAEHPALLPVLFKPDPAGFKKLATENPKALEAAGYLTIPPEVMQIDTVIGGRINEGWERKALELLPLPPPHEDEAALPTAKALIGDDYPRDFRMIAPLILERDHWSCMAGDCPEYGEGLHVHHINHNKNDNVPNNLISLCGSCHGKVHQAQAHGDPVMNDQLKVTARRRTADGTSEWRMSIFKILGDKLDWRSWKETEALERQAAAKGTDDG